MTSFSRRDFLKTSAFAAATLVAAEPELTFPTDPRSRLAVTSWPFRDYMAAPGKHDTSKKLIDARDFAAVIAERFDIHNINPLTSHFGSTEPAYLEQLRGSTAKAGSHIVDLGHGGRPFYHPDSARRQEAVAFGKKGVDIAVAIGSPSMRQHVNPAPGGKADVNLAAETLGEVAAYGEKHNIVINLENDAPVCEDPYFLIAVIEKVHSPYLRGLPDFANSMNPRGDAEWNYKAVGAMFQHAFNMAHVKSAFAADGKLYQVDLARLFAIAKQAGYRGYFSMEADMPGDPFENTRQLAEATIKHLS